jgi:hypothetical protein
MEKVLQFKKGTITLGYESILIKDKALIEYKLRIITAISWMVFGTFSVLRYLQTGDAFLLWTGLFIGIGHMAILIMSLFRTTRNEILYNQVESIHFTNKLGVRSMKIKLKGNVSRYVSALNMHEIEALKDALQEKCGNEIVN